jgi:hypothetical protein
MQDYSHLVPGLSLPSMNATNMVTHPESQAVALTGTGSTSVLPLPDALDRTPLPDMSDAHDLPVNTMKPRLDGAPPRGLLPDWSSPSAGGRQA